MFTRVGTVSIFVKDQDRAKEFYVQKLGLELRNDTPLFPGATVRWLAVAPEGADTEIILYLPDDNWAHYEGVLGKSQAVTLDVDDLAATAADLRANGVNFINEPEEQFWGKFAIIEDSEGNHLVIVEQSGN